MIKKISAHPTALNAGDFTRAGNFDLEYEADFNVSRHQNLPYFNQSINTIQGFNGYEISSNNSFLIRLEQAANMYKGLIAITDVIRNTTINSLIVSKIDSSPFSKEKYDLLNNRISKEISSNPSISESDRKKVTKSFKNLLLQISEINYIDFDVEVSILKAIRIKLLLSSNKFLVITKPFGNVEDVDDNEVIFSIFKNRKCLVSDIIDIHKLVKGINEYLVSE